MHALQLGSVCLSACLSFSLWRYAAERMGSATCGLWTWTLASAMQPGYQATSRDNELPRRASNQHFSRISTHSGFVPLRCFVLTQALLPASDPAKTHLHLLFKHQCEASCACRAGTQALGVLQLRQLGICCRFATAGLATSPRNRRRHNSSSTDAKAF